MKLTGWACCLFSSSSRSNLEKACWRASKSCGNGHEMLRNSRSQESSKPFLPHKSAKNCSFTPLNIAFKIRYTGFLNIRIRPTKCLDVRVGIKRNVLWGSHGSAKKTPERRAPPIRELGSQPMSALDPYSNVTKILSTNEIVERCLVLHVTCCVYLCQFL